MGTFSNIKLVKRLFLWEMRRMPSTCLTIRKPSTNDLVLNNCRHWPNSNFKLLVKILKAYIQAIGIGSKDLHMHHGTTQLIHVASRKPGQPWDLERD